MATNLNLQDYQVVIDGETYSLLETPATDSRLVKSEIDNVLKAIQLDELMGKLQRTGDFINLAYNSTPSKYGDIRASIGNIHDRFGVLCGKCMQEMGAIEDATKSLLPTFNRVFKFLVSGEDEIALQFLGRASSVAKKLGASMSALSGEFDKLADQSAQAMQASEKARGQELRDAEAMKKHAAELEASIAQAEELSKRLEQSRKELEKLYEEARQKTEKAEDRAFALSLVGAILTPIAQAAGAVAGAYASARNPMRMVLPPDPPQNSSEPAAQDKADSDELKQKKEAAETTLNAAKEKEKAAADKLVQEEKKLETARQEVAKADAALKAAGTAEGDDDAKKAAQKALTQAKTAQEESESARDIAQAALDKAKQATADADTRLLQAAKALADCTRKIAEEMKKQGDSYAAIAEGYRQEKLKYLDMLMAKKDKEIEVSANLKKYAVQMKNANDQEMTAEITAKALFNVIAALRQVVAVLRDMTFFWTNMASHCDKLADPSFVVDVQAMQSKSIVFKQEIYTDQQFKTGVVSYIAGWVALGRIAKDYMRASSDIRKKVMEDYGTYLDDDAARAKAKTLGGQLLGDIDTDMDAANDDKKAIETERNETRRQSDGAQKAA